MIAFVWGGILLGWFNFELVWTMLRIKKDYESGIFNSSFETLYWELYFLLYSLDSLSNYLLNSLCSVFHSACAKGRYLWSAILFYSSEDSPVELSDSETESSDSDSEPSESEGSGSEGSGGHDSGYEASGEEGYDSDSSQLTTESSIFGSHPIDGDASQETDGGGSSGYEADDEGMNLDSDWISEMDIDWDLVVTLAEMMLEIAKGFM